METGLLVGGGKRRALGVALRDERSGQVELEALCKVVLGFHLGAEVVGGRPGLCEDNAMGLVGVFGFNFAVDEAGLRILVAVDPEGDVGGRRGLYLKVGAMDGEVLAEKVVGGLSEILYASWTC